MTVPAAVSGGGQLGRPRAGARSAGAATGGLALAFDDFAERYARFNELRDPLLPTAGWLADHLPGGERAVDLGCGDGLHTARLADRYGQVLAVDLSAGLLEIARARHHRPNLTYQHRDVAQVTPELDGVFDAVISVNTLHHVGPLGEVFAAVRRLVAPGGRLLVADIVGGPQWADRSWHIDQAFAGAKRFYELADGDPEVAADALRLLLHPRWLDMSTSDLPPTREEFHRQVREVFPDAELMDGLHPVMCGFSWVRSRSSAAG